MSKDIAQIDKNLAVTAEIDAPDCVFHDVRKAPFELYGFYNPQNEPVFRRIPEPVAEQTNKQQPPAGLFLRAVFLLIFDTVSIMK